MRDDCWESDAPVVDALGQPRRDRDAILKILRPLLGHPLLYISRDAIHREDLAPHSRFTALICHFLIISRTFVYTTVKQYAYKCCPCHRSSPTEHVRYTKSYGKDLNVVKVGWTMRGLDGKGIQILA